MRSFRKIISLATVAILALGALSGCGSASSSASDTITVISREDGSGTRGAFIELFGIEQKDADGNKVDHTIATADQTNSTGVMLQSVSQNSSAIGYVSLGALNDSVKAVEIDGVAATVENVKNGSYAVSRPFNIATGSDVGELAQDFIDFILSDNGQAIVEDNGYISAGGSGSFTTSGAAGSIVVAGSSSVSPVMEKLIEAYKLVNTGANIELQTSDSTTGMNSVADSICDIGMASRELKDSELEAGLNPTVIAIDGIAVIVSTENEVSALTSAQVLGIYTGEITSWSEVK